MRRVLGIIGLLVAGLACGAPAAFAQAYPTNTPLVVASTSTPAAGSQVTFVAEGFAPGASVTFTYGLVAGTNAANVRTAKAATSGTLGTATANASGRATLVATAPTDAGTYLISASSPDGTSASTTITVLSGTGGAGGVLPGGGTGGAGGTLPGTGSDFGSTTLTAGTLLLVGAALVGGVAIRRRSRSLAS